MKGAPTASPGDDPKGGEQQPATLDHAGLDAPFGEQPENLGPVLETEAAKVRKRIARGLTAVAHARVESRQPMLGAIQQQQVDRSEQEVRRRLVRPAAGCEREQLAILGDAQRQPFVERRRAVCLQPCEPGES